MSSKPWFAWYPADYASKTSHLSFIEDSAYRRLLDAYYNRGGPIDFDRPSLFRITRAMTSEEQDAVLKVANEFFVLENNLLRNGRADSEIEKQGRIKQRLSEAGKRGGLMAGKGRPKDSDRPKVRQYSQSQSQRSNPSVRTKGSSDAKVYQPEWFEDFWREYPKKEAKQDAIKAWNSLKPSAETMNELMPALLRIKETESWTKEDGKYIPQPSRWLRGMRWKDQPTHVEPESRMGKFVI